MVAEIEPKRSFRCHCDHEVGPVTELVFRRLVSRDSAHGMSVPPCTESHSKQADSGDFLPEKKKKSTGSPDLMPSGSVALDFHLAERKISVCRETEKNPIK